MKIISVEFTKGWSWGLVGRALYETMMEQDGNIQIERETMKIDVQDECDAILCQQVTLLAGLHRKARTACRLGGNKTFTDNGSRAVCFYLEQMKQCHSIIATNHLLHDIGKLVNPNTFLVPNGLDLQSWCPNYAKERRDGFRVGFCGNISLPQYRQYKGFDAVEKACNALNVELVTACYGDDQIPHDRMRDDFYHKIDCLVHPTLGEGCSNTIMEALACGVPVITTRAAGLHGEELTMFKDVLFCERIAESIKACVRLLMDSEGLRDNLSRNGREYAERRHDIRKIAEEYRKILGKCAEDNSGVPDASKN